MRTEIQLGRTPSIILSILEITFMNTRMAITDGEIRLDEFPSQIERSILSTTTERDLRRTELILIYCSATSSFPGSPFGMIMVSLRIFVKELELISAQRSQTTRGELDHQS